MRTVLLLSASLMLPVFGETIDDVIRLSKGGVSDDIITTWASRQPRVAPTADNILKLQEAKVSDKVIMALISNGKPGEAEHAVTKDGWIRKANIPQEQARAK